MIRKLIYILPELFIPNLEFIKKAQLPSFEFPVYSGSEFNFGRELDIDVSYLNDEVHVLYDNKKLIVGNKAVIKDYIFIPVTNIISNRFGNHETIACYFLVQLDGDTEEHFEKAVARFTKTFNVVKLATVVRKLENQLLNQDLIQDIE